MLLKEQKQALRKEMLQLRNSLSPEAKWQHDQRITAALEKLILERGVKVLHSFLPMPQEIDFYPLLNKLLQEGLTIVCPKTLPKRVLENRILQSFDELESGVMGTKHPAKADIYEGPYDLIIVPGLAFDAEHYRLGYGGGYYDRFLVQHPEALKVGVFYPFQEVPTVPREEHDARFDVVIC